MPFGRSVSSKNSARRSDPIGVALAGFTTIGAPTRERRRHLVRDEVQREVERGDPEHRPDREAAEHTDPRAERLLGVQPHQLVVAVADHLGGPAERARWRAWPRPWPTSAACRPRGDQLRVLLDRLREALRDVVERVGPRPHGQLLRLLERGGGGRDRLLDVGRGRDARSRRRRCRRTGSSPRTCPRRCATRRSRGTDGRSSSAHHLSWRRGAHTDAPPAIVVRAVAQSSDTITCLMFV